MKLFPWTSLLTWYAVSGRHDLEWRDYSMDDDLRAYRVWLAEICLQQTQVERVRGYFTRILSVYPSVHDLARASYEEFFPYYQGMGYYSRARNLLATARIISSKYA
jgi:A/G-specific adenine glycosylase